LSGSGGRKKGVKKNTVYIRRKKEGKVIKPIPRKSETTHHRRGEQQEMGQTFEREGEGEKNLDIEQGKKK